MPLEEIEFFHVYTNILDTSQAEIRLGCVQLFYLNEWCNFFMALWAMTFIIRLYIFLFSG